MGVLPTPESARTEPHAANERNPLTLVTTMRLLATAVLSLALVGASFAQSPAEALRAEAKNYALADIPDDYRALTLGGNGELTPWLLFGAFGGGSSQKGSERLLFRSLGAVWVQPDEFAELLDGKRARIRGFRLDIASIAGSGEDVAPVFAESWLEAGRIQSWSPSPDLSKAALAKAFAENATRNSDATATAISTVDTSGAVVLPATSSDLTSDARLNYAKQAATATMMYSGDYDDAFPKADSSAKFYTAVFPYVKSREVFTPSTQSGRLLYNTHLSGVTMNAIDRPAETILLWEERAWPDGKRAVAFVDGHAKRLDAAEWERLWTAELARREARRRPGAPARRTPGMAARSGR